MAVSTSLILPVHPEVLVRRALPLRLALLAILGLMPPVLLARLVTVRLARRTLEHQAKHQFLAILRLSLGRIQILGRPVPLARPRLLATRLFLEKPLLQARRRLLARHSRLSDLAVPASKVLPRRQTQKSRSEGRRQHRYSGLRCYSYATNRARLLLGHP